MKPFFSLLTLLLLVSCKSTSLTPINAGSDPKWSGEPHYEVLVAVLSYDPELRRIFEDEMADELDKQGINAVQSYTVMPRVASLNAATFTKFLSADPTLAVLFVQAKSVQKEQTSSNAEEPNVFTNLFGGGEWDTTFVAMMESALYVNGQTDAVWWSRVRLEAKDTKVQEVAEQFVQDSMKVMKQSGAISRLK